MQENSIGGGQIKLMSQTLRHEISQETKPMQTMNKRNWLQMFWLWFRTVFWFTPFHRLLGRKSKVQQEELPTRATMNAVFEAHVDEPGFIEEHFQRAYEKKPMGSTWAEINANIANSILPEIKRKWFEELYGRKN
jgi:hypothetical protein